MILMTTLSIFAVVIVIALAGTIRLRLLRRSLTLAVHEFSEGDHQRLRRFLKDGKNPGRYTDLLHFLEDRECYDLAHEVILKIPPLAQKPRYLAMAMARVFIVLDLHAQALSCLKTIEEKAGDGSLLEILCKVYIGLEEHDLFLEKYKLYLGTKPQGSKKWVFEAYALMFQNEFDLAKPLLEKALTREQNILNNSLSPLMKQELGKQLAYTQKAIDYWKARSQD